MLLFQINLLRTLFVRDQPMVLEDPPALSDDPGNLDGQLVATTSVSPMNQKVAYANEEGVYDIIRNANVHRLNEFVLGGYSDITVQVNFVDDFNV